MNYSEYRKAWEDGLKGIVPPIPLNLDIEISSVCNLKCPMCPQSNLAPENKKFMGFLLFKRIIDEAVITGVPAIKLNWRGEPTLHPQFPEILDYVKGKFIDIRINTNGTHDKKIIPQMIDVCDKIIYSVDSTEQEILDIIRPKLIIFRMSTNFTEINNNPKSEDKIIINFTTQKENESEYEEIKRWCKMNGYKFNPRLMFPRTEKDKDFVKTKRKIIGRKNCGYPFQRLTIGWDGNVHPCCVDWKEIVNIGNVKKNNLGDLWYSADISYIREYLKGKSILQCKLCDNCTSWMGYEYEDINGLKT